jgi:hypothetical protein
MTSVAPCRIGGWSTGEAKVLSTRTGTGPGLDGGDVQQLTSGLGRRLEHMVGSAVQRAEGDDVSGSGTNGGHEDGGERSHPCADWYENLATGHPLVDGSSIGGTWVPSSRRASIPPWTASVPSRASSLSMRNLSIFFNRPHEQ